ncbi:MAG TPA: DUF4350 domain-containing protein [Planctomycetaceae bacterium]|nr:DUF4350 domain-containing protein [Planctomycetaceae bacterium]
MQQTTNQPQNGQKSRSTAASVAWLVALAAALGLQVWFPRIDVEVNDTYNVDIGGRNAFYQFAERRAADARRNHEPLVNLLEQLAADKTLCLLGPARYPSPREWSALLAWVAKGGSLVLAARLNEPELDIPGLAARVKSTSPKPRLALFGAESDDDSVHSRNNDEKAEKSQPADDGPGEPVDSKEPAASSNRTTLIAGTDFTWKCEGTVVAPSAAVLVETRRGRQAVQIRHGNGTIVLMASDFIFSNAALFDRQRENCFLAVKLLEAAGPARPVVFDESLNATGTPRVVGILLDPTLRPLTLQLIVAIIAFGWRGNHRFGGLLPKSSPARHDVADHTNSLGNLYYKAHHGTGVLREYLEQMTTEFRLRHAGSHRRRVLQSIADKAQMPVDELQSLLSEARSSAAKPRLSRHHAALMIRKLAQVREAIRQA